MVYNRYTIKKCNQLLQLLYNLNNKFNLDNKNKKFLGIFAYISNKINIYFYLSLNTFNY